MNFLSCWFLFILHTHLKLCQSLIFFHSSGKPTGYDRVRNAEIGNKDFELDVLEEAYTSEHWIVRIYKVGYLELWFELNILTYQVFLINVLIIIIYIFFKQLIVKKSLYVVLTNNPCKLKKFLFRYISTTSFQICFVIVSYFYFNLTFLFKKVKDLDNRGNSRT